MAVTFRLSFSLFFIMILSSSIMALYEEMYINYRHINKIKNDTPLFKDLMIYIPLLNRVIDFCQQNTNILSINLMYGLFLLNVNLYPFVKDEHIPKALRTDLEQIIARSEKLQTEFKSSTDRKMKNVFAVLPSNATSWSKRLKKLNFELLKRKCNHDVYPLWQSYLKTTGAMSKGIPSPRQSDICVGYLANNYEILSEDLNRRCNIPDKCYKTIINGTNFGYWLTHRIMLLLHARLSRNCAIFSSHEDELYRLQLCGRAYREAEYIALNGFQLVDLLLEQIAICSLDGHAQFLRRSWLINILDYQQTSGCIQLYKVDPRYKEDVKNCDDHAMGVALAAYAAAIRLLLENWKH